MATWRGAWSIVTGVFGRREGGLEVGVAYYGGGRCVVSGRAVLTVVGVAQVRGVACGGAWLGLRNFNSPACPVSSLTGPSGAGVAQSVCRQTQG